MRPLSSCEQMPPCVRVWKVLLTYIIMDLDECRMPICRSWGTASTASTAPPALHCQHCTASTAPQQPAGQQGAYRASHCEESRCLLLLYCCSPRALRHALSQAKRHADKIITPMKMAELAKPSFSGEVWGSKGAQPGRQRWASVTCRASWQLSIYSQTTAPL